MDILSLLGSTDLGRLLIVAASDDPYKKSSEYIIIAQWKIPLISCKNSKKFCNTSFKWIIQQKLSLSIFEKKKYANVERDSVLCGLSSSVRIFATLFRRRKGGKG